MISNIVANLLKTSECVTIPEFGAFVINPANAQIDVAKNRFTPPGKRVSFNKNIQNNDGLLANALANQEGISYEDAVSYLKGFVESVKLELKSKHSFDFLEVGSFYLTDGNLLKFEPNTISSSLEFGLEPFHLTPLSNDSVIGKELVGSVAGERKVEIKYVSKLSTWGKVGWAVAALPFLAYVAWVPAQSGVLDKQKNFQFSDLNPFRAAPCEEFVARPAGLIDLSLDSEDLLYPDFNESTFRFAIPETTNVVVEIPKVITTELRYQIIGGCFSKKSYANRMVSSLSDKGYSAFIFDQKNGLYRVSYGGYSTMKEARKTLKKVKANDNSSAWLLKK